MPSRDHGDPGDAPSVPPPLTPVADSTKPSAAEEARTIAGSTNTGTVATLTDSGDPWASYVTYGLHIPVTRARSDINRHTARRRKGVQASGC